MFKIVRNLKYYVAGAMVVIIAGLIAFFAFGGYRMDIDFSGGTMLHIDMEKEYSMQDLNDAIVEFTGKDVYSLQKSGDAFEVIAKMPSMDTAERTELYSKLKERFALVAEAPLAMENVTPTISNEILYNAMLAIILSMVLILLYVSFRFEFYSGLAAIAALVHDVLIMLAVYAIFRIPVNSNFVAAILTVIGFSINDTIVIFDRIRENKKFMKKVSFEEICDVSIWQTMRRSLNTVGTVVVTLLVLYFMGVTSIKEFALPIMIGVVSGSYSSIFIAAPLWHLMVGKDKDVKVSGKKLKKA